MAVLYVLCKHHTKNLQRDTRFKKSLDLTIPETFYHISPKNAVCLCLRQLGYTGPVVASRNTLEQLPFHLEAGQIEMLRYPVHLNRAQMETLAGENSFSKVIAYHCPEIPSEEVYRV